MNHEDIYPALDRSYRLGRYLLQEILFEVAIWAGQDRVLCALKPDESNFQCDLSRKLFMDPKCLHRSLKYLEKVRCISYTHSSTDFRVNVVRMTDWGRFCADTIRHTYGIVGKQMCVGMSMEEKERFTGLLETSVMRERELRSRKLDLREVLDRGRF